MASTSPQDSQGPEEKEPIKSVKTNAAGSSKDRPRTNPTLFIEGDTTPLTSSLPLWEASNILTQRKHLPWVMDPDGKDC